MAKRKAEEDDLLNCSICFEIFKEPKTLTCLHRFCEMCLKDYIKRQKHSVLLQERGFSCPICREKIQVPDPTKPPSEWANMLKTDFSLKKFIQATEEKRSLREKTSCLIKENKSDMTTGPGTPMHPCNEHKGTELDLYCEDCKRIICHLCAGVYHRDCKEVVTVTDAAADNKLVRQNFLARLASLVHYKRKSMRSLNQASQKVREDVQKRCDELRSQIRDEELRTLKRLDKHVKEAAEKINNESTEIFELMKGVTASNSDFDILNFSLSVTADGRFNRYLNCKNRQKYDCVFNAGQKIDFGKITLHLDEMEGDI